MWHERPLTEDRLDKGKGKGQSKNSELKKLTMPVGIIVGKADIAYKLRVSVNFNFSALLHSACQSTSMCHRCTNAFASSRATTQSSI